MSFFEKIGLIGIAGILLVAAPGGVAAKEKTPPPMVRSWRSIYDFGMVDSVALDTTWTKAPLSNIRNDHSIAYAYNGNYVSPMQSKIYFDRDGNGLQTGLVRPKLDCILASQYAPYLITPTDVRYYQTNIAYSKVEYRKGLTSEHQDGDLRFAFTGNVRKNINLGLDINYLNAPGLYANQQGKCFTGDVFGSYDGKHYSLRGAVTFNTLSNFENGGLTTPEDLGGLLNPADLPTRMHGMSGARYTSGYLHHQYLLTKEVNDSTELPLITFGHTFEVDNVTRRYIEQRVHPNDTANVLVIRNTVSASFEEAFNKWLRFGATIYASNECERYQYNRYRTDTLAIDTTFGTKWTNNTRVGGAIYKNTGRYIRYNVNGDVCLVGYKIGEFQVNGHLDGEFPLKSDTLYVRAEAYVKNETPDYFLQHYHSHHLSWSNHFDKTYRIYAGGEVRYPTRWLKPSVRVGFENLTRSIYFDGNGHPCQHSGNIQVLSVNGHLDLTTPWINLENNAVWQLSSDSTISLPALTLYHNLYYHGAWAKKALYAQIGVDMHFHTRYYAPLLEPTTGQFVCQQNSKVGGYPLLSAYLQLYVRSLRLKLFAQLSHFNYYFTRQHTYFSMPGYAENPAEFRIGAAWQFWR